MKSVRSNLMACATLVVVLGASLAANAEVLNVAWRGGEGWPAGGGRVSYTGLGAAPDDPANTTWNNLDTAGLDYSEFSSLVYSNGGNATGVSIKLNGVSSFTPGSSPTLALFNGHLVDSGDNVSLDVKGLSDSLTYDVYLYSARAIWPGDTTSFSINGGPVKSVAVSTNTSTFIEQGNTDANYVKYSAQSSVNGVLNIQFGGPGGGVFSGMQIMSVPEPSTMALGAVGLCGLLAYAWRKRR